MNSFYKSPGAVKLEHLKIYLDELLHRNYGGITRGAVGANNNSTGSGNNYGNNSRIRKRKLQLEKVVVNGSVDAIGARLPIPPNAVLHLQIGNLPYGCQHKYLSHSD